jgi:hypothetical protein
VDGIIDFGFAADGGVCREKHRLRSNGEKRTDSQAIQQRILA